MTATNETTLQHLKDLFPRPVLKRCTEGSSPHPPQILTRQQHATNEEIAEAIRQWVEAQEFTDLVLGRNS